MRHIKFGSILVMAMILAACGGNSDVPAKPKFSALVSFGDSLSDVGTYNVGPIALAGGGQFTINAASSVKATTPTNWTEFVSLSLNLGMPCAAETGGFGVTPSTHPGCNGYAQGGARVTDPVGIGNPSSLVKPGLALTVPVFTQIQNYLTAHGGSFSGNEVVTVMAGANDVFTLAGLVGGGAISPASAVVAVQTAASELANDVNTQILGNGAKHVVVVNVPDIASTPNGNSINDGTTNPTNPAIFLNTLVTTFNSQLKANLPDSANVLNVDAYSASADEVANPDKYLIINKADSACNVASSLTCNASTLSVSDPSHYLFADDVHPTPYGHLLFATYVLQAMTNKGWY